MMYKYNEFFNFRKKETYQKQRDELKQIMFDFAEKINTESDLLKHHDINNDDNWKWSVYDKKLSGDFLPKHWTRIDLNYEEGIYNINLGLQVRPNIVQSLCDAVESRGYKIIRTSDGSNSFSKWVEFKRS